jgi:hypothetical protein
VDAFDKWIRRHDDYQAEVKLEYNLDRQRRKDLYTVEYFFFLPQNLDVNAATYSKEEFYRDLLLYIRFQAPDLSLEELADESDRRSPLRKTREKLENFRRMPSAYNATVLEYELKLLACILKDALAGRLRALRRTLEEDKRRAEGLAAETAAKARRVADRFRAFRPDFEDSALPPSLRSAFAFVDEYVSLMIEGYAHHMLRALQEAAAGSDGLAGVIEGELDYRRKRGFPSLVDEACDNETFVFRLSVLKKYTAAALHLTVRTEKEHQGIEELGLALAAGLAMVFATAIAFYTQQVHGGLSISFFVALVVSYMFKDRIKSLMQRTFLRFRSDRFMDLSSDLFDPFTKERIGECRELVHFMPESRVDPRVLHLRNRDHITEIENAFRTEKVLHYLKEIVLYPRRMDAQSRKTGLTDIARFNLRNFLLKMDEARREVFVLREGRSEAVPAARVYHVNLVVKFTGAGKTRYERVRLVLTQEGIKRIEPVRGEEVSEE